jgi:hypothetical protein
MASNTLSGAGVTPANTKNQLLHIGTGSIAAGSALRLGDGSLTKLSLHADGIGIDGLKLSSQLGATAETGVTLPMRLAVLGADWTNSTVTHTAVGLSLPVLANGLYEIDALLVTRSAATTTGAQFRLAGPAEFTWLAARWSQLSLAGLAAGTNDYMQNIRAWDVNFAALVSPEANQPFLTVLRGMLKIGASAPTSQVSIQGASEVAASEVRALAGSFLKLTRLA